MSAASATAELPVLTQPCPHPGFPFTLSKAEDMLS